MGWYIGFEPNRKTFEKCSVFVNGQKEKLGMALLYPCGVGDKTEMCRFEEAESASCSKISETGSEIVPVVKIDDTIPAFPESKLLLKMDVEGYESAVLDGAKTFIKENRPDLLVCTYHKVTDLWRLLSKIHRAFPGYRFYLRCYTVVAVETILYAIYSKG